MTKKYPLYDVIEHDRIAELNLHVADLKMQIAFKNKQLKADEQTMLIQQNEIQNLKMEIQRLNVLLGANNDA